MMATVSTFTRNTNAMKLDTLANFNDNSFESRLESLKDTQDGIQAMSTWCLTQRSHHKKIVSSWLNVFKRVGVEHRLTLFYLANDVIQYSKRKRYEFVEAWATALQRATTMVRDAKVKSKILRIFKIWEQRGIYNEEFISDLSGLLNMTPPKRNEAFLENEFQNSKLVSSIRECATLAESTDKSFKRIPKPPESDIDEIKQQLKDKTNSHNISTDMDRYVKNITEFNKTLEDEIKSRKNVIVLIDKAINYYSEQRDEVKVVVTAYKNFGNRIKLVKKKIDEMLPTLSSPVPSPDINAPSPEREAELKLPDDDVYTTTTSMNLNQINYNNSYMPEFGYQTMKQNTSQPIEVIGSRSDDESYAPNSNNELGIGDDFYKPESIGLGLRTYTEDINIPGLNSLPVPTVPQSEYTSLARAAQQYGGSDYLSTYRSDGAYGTNDYGNNSLNSSSVIGKESAFCKTWNMTGIGDWNTISSTTNNSLNLDITATPPHAFEREAHGRVIADINLNISSGIDKNLSISDLASPVKGARTKQLSLENARQVDIDHRNLISLTGSPSTNDIEKISPWPSTLNEESHQTLLTGDIDYRFPTNQHENNNPQSKPILINESLDPQNAKENRMHVETKNMVVDMELSDEDLEGMHKEENNIQQNSITSSSKSDLNCINSKGFNKREALLETPQGSEFVTGSPPFVRLWDGISNVNSVMRSSPPPPPPPPQLHQDDLTIEQNSAPHWPMNWNSSGMVNKGDGNTVSVGIPPPPCPPPPFTAFPIAAHIGPPFPASDYSDTQGSYAGPNTSNNTNNHHHQGSWMPPPHHSPRNYGPRPMRGNPFFGRGCPTNVQSMGRGSNNQYRNKFRGKPSWI